MSRIVWNCRGVARTSLAAVMIIATAVAVSFSSAQSRSVSSAGELSLELNIPAFRLDVFRGGERIKTYVVAVGLPRYQTPVGDFSVTRITWNPWWYPPNSDWARHEKITGPGPKNFMGKVKMLVAASVYLHASPFTSSMGRAASHGCVRMRSDDAVELARLLQSRSGAHISDASVDSLVASWSETRVVDLPVATAVRFAYELAEVRGDSLLLHPDVYGLRRGGEETEALRVLVEASLDTTQVDRAALRLLVRRARTQHVSSSIARLVSNGSAPGARPENRTSRQGNADGVDRKARTSALMNADCGKGGPNALF